MTQRGWTDEEMATAVAIDLPEGAFVNLGIGLPTLVGGRVREGRTVFFHSENGILGMGPPARPGEEDPDLVNAGKTPVTLVPGAAIVHHADSFGIIRGGHLDVAVLGAMQVSERGDLANWIVGGQTLGSIGGAMDLALGAKRTVAIMRHTDNQGRPKIVKECTYPLTAARCIDRIYTNLAVIRVTPDGLVVERLAPGVSPDDVQAVTEPPLTLCD
ncbi:MAG: 3-oxoacid CoA-transferase subunit B [Chloroflexi bacterium]|nr:3-oxoacid CoA-transferase subunit B [Chloroflexota bacterium]